MGLELQFFAKFGMDFGNFENEPPNKLVKKMSEEELDKSVEDQKSMNTSRSTQFTLRTRQTWLEQSPRRNPFKSARNKNFPGF